MINILLYGAASIGNILFKRFEHSNIIVRGFIDQRANEIGKYNGIKVFSIEETVNCFDPDSIVIFIAVKNVFEHENIARMLYKAGFSKIIYKPYFSLLGCGSEKENQMLEIYDEMFEGKEVGEAIPKLIGDEEIHHDFALIKEENETVWAYIPVTSIFTNNYQNSYMEKWGNINICAMFPHINFFRFLMGDREANITDYLEEYCIYTAMNTGIITITEAWKNNVIRNRTQIYEQMRYALDLDPDFFVRNAAEAVWNSEKKYFNLTSGKHRSTFLVAMGRQYIPLKIKRDDYRNFLNLDNVIEFDKAIKLLDEKPSIMHPFYYRGTGVGSIINWDTCRIDILKKARESYYKNGKVDFSKALIVDQSDDLGETARIYSKIGFLVTRSSKLTDIEKTANKLLYVNSIIYNDN